MTVDLPLADEIKELVEGWSTLLVVVHFLLSLLTGTTVHHTNLESTVLTLQHNRVIGQ